MGNEEAIVHNKNDVAIVWALREHEKLKRGELVEKAHKILKESDAEQVSGKKAIDNRISKLENEPLNYIKSKKDDTGQYSFKYLNPEKDLEIITPSEMKPPEPEGREELEEQTDRIIEKVMSNQESMNEMELAEKLKSPLSALWGIEEENVKECVEHCVNEIADEDAMMAVADKRGFDFEETIISIYEDSPRRKDFKERMINCLEYHL